MFGSLQKLWAIFGLFTIIAAIALALRPALLSASLSDARIWFILIMGASGGLLLGMALAVAVVEDQPLTAARARLARGEISVEEFERIAAALGR